LAAGALLLASCGGNKFEEGDLKDGRATGAGFAFTLPKGWKSELPSDATKREVARTVSKALPGLDLQGIFLAGYWSAWSPVPRGCSAARPSRCAGWVPPPSSVGSPP